MLSRRARLLAIRRQSLLSPQELERMRNVEKLEEQSRNTDDMIARLNSRVEVLDLLVNKTLPADAFLAQKEMTPWRFRKNEDLNRKWNMVNKIMTMQEIMVAINEAKSRRDQDRSEHNDLKQMATLAEDETGETEKPSVTPPDNTPISNMMKSQREDDRDLALKTNTEPLNQRVSVVCQNLIKTFSESQTTDCTTNLVRENKTDSAKESGNTDSSQATDTNTDYSQEIGTNTDSYNVTNTNTVSSNVTSTNIDSFNVTETNMDTSNVTEKSTDSSHVIEKNADFSHVKEKNAYSETHSGSPHVIETYTGFSYSIETHTSIPHVIETHTGSPYVIKTNTGSPHVTESHTGSPHVTETDSSNPTIITTDSDIFVFKDGVNYDDSRPTNSFNMSTTKINNEQNNMILQEKPDTKVTKEQNSSINNTKSTMSARTSMEKPGKQSHCTINESKPTTLTLKPLRRPGKQRATTQLIKPKPSVIQPPPAMFDLGPGAVPETCRYCGQPACAGLRFLKMCQKNVRTGGKHSRSFLSLNIRRRLADITGIYGFRFRVLRSTRIIPARSRK